MCARTAIKRAARLSGVNCMREGSIYRCLIAIELVIAFMPIFLYWCLGIVYLVLFAIKDFYLFVKEFYWIYLAVLLGGLGLWGVFRAYIVFLFPKVKDQSHKITLLLLGCGSVPIAVVTYIIGVGFDFRLFITVLPIIATIHLCCFINRASHANS